VTHAVRGFSSLSVRREPTVDLTIEPIEGGAEPLPTSPGEPLTFEIRPGETIRLNVKADRNGFKKRIQLGKEDAGRNLPFGVIVDNIGLNGLMIVEEESERDFFITADRTVGPQERLFHLEADVPGKPTTQPVRIRVVE
jgi:hypothetical protein